ncbi:MAG: thioredoxin-disulfide reductase [Clostridiales bacterium]|nr:thioredoxin-disulfide reductase [Clostridiales bacterium]
MKDVIIIGGGIAGLSAGIYTQRGGLDSLLFERIFTGGQAATTDLIENYPGFVEPISGPEFANNLTNHAKRFELPILYDEVTELQLDGHIKRVITNKETYEAKTLILAMGAQPRPLGLPGEEAFRGRGVSYCATCDGFFYRDKAVAVVGGGDTALSDAIYLSQHAKKVYLIHRRDEFRGAKMLQDRVFERENIEVVWNSVVNKIITGDKVKGLILEDVINKRERQVQIDGLFVAVGVVPNNQLVEGKMNLNDAGFIKADENMATEIAGVFVAGDLREKMLLQLITAAADGAIAATSAQNYIAINFT